MLKSTPNVRKSPRSGLNLEGRLSDSQFGLDCPQILLRPGYGFRRYPATLDTRLSQIAFNGLGTIVLVLVSTELVCDGSFEWVEMTNLFPLQYRMAQELEIFEERFVIQR